MGMLIFLAPPVIFLILTIIFGLKALKPSKMGCAISIVITVAAVLIPLVIQVARGRDIAREGQPYYPEPSEPATGDGAAVPPDPTPADPTPGPDALAYYLLEGEIQSNLLSYM